MGYSPASWQRQIDGEQKLCRVDLRLKSGVQNRAQASLR
jgi:hypothetical protein